MARDEADREDLLREATALVERIELRVSNMEQSVVIGFRPCGAASFFFGSDPVYQFNSAGQLRRAFVDGLLYKAERGGLVSLRRDRTASATQLLRRDLSAARQTKFLATAQNHLSHLAEALKGGNYEIVGQVPPATDVLTRTDEALARLTEIQVAPSPRVS
ncbi:MAG: hypothetical protein OES79_02360 [Planctomycetota bacterium]|nr:hypothetical protein [Planctomycetota bacterium]